MPATAGAIRAGRAFVEIFADDSKLSRGLKSAGARLQAWGKGLATLGGKIQLAGAAVVVPLSLMAKAFASAGDELDKMSARTGLTVEFLSGLTFAASQGGTEIGQLEIGIRNMQRLLGASKGKTDLSELLAFGDAERAMGALKLNLAELKKLTPEEQFLKIVDALHKIEDPTQRSAAAMKIFGSRVGTALLPLGDAQAIVSKLEEAKGLGLIINRDEATAAAKFTDALDVMTRQLGMLRIVAGEAVAPALTQLIEHGKGLLAATIAWFRSNQELVISLFNIGAVAIGVGAGLAGIGLVMIGVGAAFKLATGVVYGFLKPLALGAKLALVWSGAVRFLLRPLSLLIDLLADLAFRGAHAVLSLAGALGGMLLKAITAVATAIGRLFIVALQKLGQVVLSVLAAVAQIAIELVFLLPAGLGVVVVLGLLTAAWLVFVDVLGAVVGLVAVTSAALTGLAASLAAVGALLGLVVSAITLLLTPISTMTFGVGLLVAALGGVAAGFVGAFFGKDELADRVNDALTRLRWTLGFIARGFSEVLDPGRRVGDLWSWLKQVGVDTFETIVEFIDQNSFLFRRWANQVGQVVKGVGKLLTEFAEAQIKAFVPDSEDVVSAWGGLKKVVTAALDVLTVAVDNFGLVMGLFNLKLQKIFAEIRIALNDAIEGILRSFLEAAEGNVIFSNIIGGGEGITKAIEKINRRSGELRGQLVGGAQPGQQGLNQQIAGKEREFQAAVLFRKFQRVVKEFLEQPKFDQEKREDELFRLIQVGAEAVEKKAPQLGVEGVGAAAAEAKPPVSGTFSGEVAARLAASSSPMARTEDLLLQVRDKLEEIKRLERDVRGIQVV